jgi:spermidine/putrescine transport system substrate-binding protein
MFRKILIVLCLALLVIIPVTASAQDEIATTWTCPEGFEGQTLNLYNWTTYVAEDTIPNFEALCGVTIVQTFFGSNEEMIARLRTGNPGYDIVLPTGAFIPLMVREELLQPIDLSMIPNFANVIESFQSPAYDPENMYSVPYQWGTMGVGYNQEALGEPLTSWEQVWNYSGNVAWIEDPRNVMGFALHNMGFDPNTTNPDEISEAANYLIERGSNVRAIAQDDGQERLQTGEVDIVIEYSGDIFQIIADCEANPDKGCAGRFNYVLPEEGAIRWVDNLAIPTGAPNPALAHVFFDYILDAQVGADISNYTAFSTPNQASIDQALILPELLENPILYPTEEQLAGLYDIIDVGDEAAQIYNDAWNEVKVLLGA